MKKRKGFIATSLIYSFFLVFIAILVSIMANYTSTRVQLNRLKQDAKEELNKCTVSSTPYCSN